MAWNKLPEMFGPNPIDCPWDEANPVYAANKGKGGLFGPKGYMECNPSQEQQFMRAMSFIDSLGGEDMADAGPFHKFKRIIDVGGSQGRFLIRLLKMYPDKTGVLMDRPSVIALAQESNSKN